MSYLESCEIKNIDNNQVLKVLKTTLTLIGITLTTLPAHAQIFSQPNALQNFAQTYCTLRRGGMSDKKATNLAFNTLGASSEMLWNAMFERKSTKEALKAAVLGTCPEIVGYPSPQHQDEKPQPIQPLVNQ